MVLRLAITVAYEYRDTGRRPLKQYWVGDTWPGGNPEIDMFWRAVTRGLIKTLNGAPLPQTACEFHDLIEGPVWPDAERNLTEELALEGIVDENTWQWLFFEVCRQVGPVDLTEPYKLKVPKGKLVNDPEMSREERKRLVEVEINRLARKSPLLTLRQWLKRVYGWPPKYFDDGLELSGWLSPGDWPSLQKSIAQKLLDGTCNRGAIGNDPPAHSQNVCAAQHTLAKWDPRQGRFSFFILRAARGPLEAWVTNSIAQGMGFSLINNLLVDRRGDRALRFSKEGLLRPAPVAMKICPVCGRRYEGDACTQEDRTRFDPATTPIVADKRIIHVGKHVPVGFWPCDGGGTISDHFYPQERCHYVLHTSPGHPEQVFAKTKCPKQDPAKEMAHDVCRLEAFPNLKIHPNVRPLEPKDIKFQLKPGEVIGPSAVMTTEPRREIIPIPHPQHPCQHEKTGTVLWMRDDFAPLGSVLAEEGDGLPAGFWDAILRAMAFVVADLSGWERMVLIVRAREGEGEENLLASVKRQNNFTDLDLETLASLLILEQGHFPETMTDEELIIWLSNNGLPSPPSNDETTVFMEHITQTALAEAQRALKAANIDPEQLEEWLHIQYKEDTSDENA